MTLKVLGSRVLVRPDKPAEIVREGVVIPEQRDSDDVFTGTVVAVGKGTCAACSQPLVYSVNVGDSVGYEVQGGQKIDVGGETFLVLWIEDLMFVTEAA